MAVESYNAAYSAQGYVPQYTQAVYQQRARSPYFGQTNEVDSFEHSGGGFGSALLYTTLGAGAGAGLGYYMFGNPISESEGTLKVDSKFYQSLDNAAIQGEISKKIAEAEVGKLKGVGINTKEEFEALKKLANAESYEALSDDVKNALPKDVKTPEAASSLVQKGETALAEVDKGAISQAARENYLKNTVTYKELSDQLKNLNTLEEQVKGLADDIKPNQMKEFIETNKSLFNLKGDEAAVNAEIERLSKLSKKELLAELNQAKTTGSSILKTLDQAITRNYSTESKSLLKEAPEVLKNAFKDFQWSQAKRFGLWGAGIAFGTYLMSSMFGGGGSSRR